MSHAHYLLHVWFSSIYFGETIIFLPAPGESFWKKEEKKNIISLKNAIPSMIFMSYSGYIPL